MRDQVEIDELLEEEVVLARSSLVVDDKHGLEKLHWFPGLPYDTAASIRAAANPDPNILRTLLKYGKKYYLKSQLDMSTIPRYADWHNEYGPNALNSIYFPGHTSALLQAIRSQLPNNVAILLQAGADPDGVPLNCMSYNAAGFLRFGPHLSVGDIGQSITAPCYQREHLLKRIERPQMSELTRKEIEDRFEDCTARFWSEASFRRLSQLPHGDAVPAVVEAAQGASIDILDQIFAANPDCSFWISTSSEIPSPATPSSLALATPLHSAVWSRNEKMLACLLSRGFDPNVMPLAAITRCITPAMSTIVYCDPWNSDA